MEKLNFDLKKEVYQLEVNDKGDFIEFDLTDIALPEKFLNASDELIKVDNEYKKEAEKIRDSEIDEVEKTRQAIKLEKEKCAEMRKIFDSFLGEGACEKIFGTVDHYNQFFELADALEPHFEKMNFNLKKAKKRLAAKYLEKNKDVI